MADLLLAHEWISSTGGSENVFRELLGSLPDADAICLWNEVGARFERPIAETGLARSRLRGHKALALPVMPCAWKSVDLSGYSTVVASSHAFAHHLAGRAAREGKAAYAYVHTPARYIWAPEVEERGRSRLAKIGSVPLRRIDRRAADARVHYAANSLYIQDRIMRSWGVESEVIYPPVQVRRIQAVPQWRDRIDDQGIFDSLPADFVLGASRLVSYKRLDLAMRVGQAIGLPVVIAGSGPHERQLREAATRFSVPVHFVGRVSDEQLFALYQAASIFVFMAVEDFGIMPVESIAAGTPVLVSAEGGAQESVCATNGGAVATSSDGPAGLAAAAEAALSVDMDAASRRAASFSVETFRGNVEKWIAS